MTDLNSVLLAEGIVDAGKREALIAACLLQLRDTSQVSQYPGLLMLLSCESKNSLHIFLHYKLLVIVETNLTSFVGA